jgi:hypothetical protein
MALEHPGSRRHILDLLASSDAPDQLDALLAPAGYHGTRPLECRPVGSDSAEEYTLRAFGREHCSGWVVPNALDDGGWPITTRTRRGT